MDNENIRQLRLSGLNGIQNNLHVSFHVAIEHLIDAIVESKHCESIDAETLSLLVEHAILTYSMDHENIKLAIVDRRGRK